jgi:hypothetical protein
VAAARQQNASHGPITRQPHAKGLVEATDSNRRPPGCKRGLPTELMPNASDPHSGGHA